MRADDAIARLRDELVWLSSRIYGAACRTQALLAERLYEYRHNRAVQRERETGTVRVYGRKGGRAADPSMLPLDHRAPTQREIRLASERNVWWSEMQQLIADAGQWLEWLETDWAVR